MTRRRGFTLVELVASLFVSSVVVAALASCIALVSRAVPDTSDPQERLRTLQSIATRITDDARFATEVTIANGRQVEMIVADRDGDDQPEAIRYSWSGTAGDALTRQQNSETAVALFNAVDQVTFAWSTDPVLAASSTGTMQITIEADRTRIVTGSRTMNLPPVADAGAGVEIGGATGGTVTSQSGSVESATSSTSSGGGWWIRFGRDSN
ncbi:MAG: prepilin-type N-terminal cleavage/methylation domain-containing protein [Planctomycetota bacterium]